MLKRSRMTGSRWARVMRDGNGDGGTGGGGGGGGGQSGGTTGTGAGGDGAGNQGNGSGAGTTDDRGYPANTPVAEMSAGQQAAYWKFHSRKHEDQLKGLGLTPGKESDELKDLRAAREELEKKRNAELSDVERLTKERDDLAAKAQTLELNKVRTDAAAEAKLPADLWEFITATDAATAKQQAEKLAERLKSTSQTSGFDQGHRPAPPAKGRDAGLAEAQRRFKKPANTTQT
ncbi:hypothetical protein [Alloactinosynnema sp. L-07]|uniref:hypothetical protein n=1 Tax=Alloactinosynnema sp. L-07 TaxID=1653480 RepID=UPI00065F0201|nr:hypothetical protein [Alloactinosynnema sp. L-07]CRK59067.1 hypothetical protein [Alloactinosynnema sp. L-07]